MTTIRTVFSAVVFAVSLPHFAAGQKPSHLLLTTNSESLLMLAGPWVPENPQQIDFDKLPRVTSEHAVVNDVHAPGSPGTILDKKRGGVNQHNYLAHHDGKFRAMWSDGPGIEDRAGFGSAMACYSRWRHSMKQRDSSARASRCMRFICGGGFSRITRSPPSSATTAAAAISTAPSRPTMGALGPRPRERTSPMPLRR
jgi:hypothetical protein